MTSSHHPEIITSDPVRISSSFTSSLGAGYKNYDNPQIALSFKLNDRLIAASTTSLRNNNNISKNIKITFELRRHLPLNSPHHSESLGFCIVRKICDHDSIHQNMNITEKYSNKNWIDAPLERSREFFQVVTESEFSSCDFVRLTLDASQLFSSPDDDKDATTHENNNDLIILCYNQTRFLAADFTLSIVISHNKNAVDHVIENLLSLKKKKNITTGTEEDDHYYSPQAPPPQSSSSSSSSSFSPSVCDESLPSSQNDDENIIIRAPSLREEEEEEELQEENKVVQPQHSPSPRQPKRAVLDPRFLLHVSKLEAIKIENKTTSLDNISTAVLSSGDDDKKNKINNSNGHKKLKNYFLDPVNCFPSNTELNRQICLHHQTNSSKRTKNGGSTHHHRRTSGNDDDGDDKSKSISTDIELRLSSNNNQLEELRRKYFSMTSLDSSTGSSVTTAKFLHCRFFVAEVSREEEEEQNRKQNIHPLPSLVGYFPLGEPDTVAHQQNSNKLEQQQQQQKVKGNSETTSTTSTSTVWKQEIQKSNQNIIKNNRIHNNNNSVLRNPNGESYEILSESPEYSDNCFLENSSSSFVKVWRSKMMKIDFYRLLMMAVNNNNNTSSRSSPVLARMEGLKFSSSKKYRIMVWIGLEEENAFGFQQQQRNKKEENGEDNITRGQSKNKNRIRNVELNFDLNVKHNAVDNNNNGFGEFRSELSVCAPSLNNTLDAVINEGRNDDEFHDCFIGCKYTTHQVYNNVSFSKFLSVQEAKEIVDKVSQSSSKKNQKHFVDCLFPPSTSTTLNFSPSSPKSANLSPTARSRKPKQLLDVKSLSIDSRWRRPKDFCNHPVLFSQTSSSSCRQGLLGSCSLLAACSSLFRARGTQFLQKLIYFCHNNSNDNDGNQNSLTIGNNSGIYAVFFFIESDWRAVIVDDYFPCRKGKLAFARCANRNEIWISLIEKALAKVFGGFNELVRGFPMDKAFEWLTGGVGNEITFSQIVERNQQRQQNQTFSSSSPTCQRLDFGDQSTTSSEIFCDLVDKMFVYLENKWPMCASSDRPEDLDEEQEQEKSIRGHTQSSSSWSFCRDCGLISNHGYSIVDVAKFSSNNKNHNKNENSDLSSSSSSSLILLKLFNPWGHFVWNGDWCDEYNDKFWNNNNSWNLEEVRKRCGIISRRENTNTNTPVGGVFSDGSFWISLQNFLKEFDYISFCRITSDQLPLRARTWIRHVDEISSKWQSNPMLNHQFLFQIPSCQTSSSSSKSNSHDVLFTRARISLEPVGVIGGGFHFHILPVDAVMEKLQPSSPRIAEIFLSNHEENNNNGNPNDISQDFFPGIYETKIVQTTDGGTFAVDNNDHILSSKTTSISKFFLTHDLIKKHQVAHAEGYFGCVFESDGETTKVFQSGKSYLLIPYRVGSGFDGSFCVTIEMNNEGYASSTEKQEQKEKIPSPRKVLRRLPVFHLQNHKIIASLQDRFILTSNYRSTLNPQFALVNNSKNDSICVHLVVDLLDQNNNNNTYSSSTSSTTTSEDAGLEIVVVREKGAGSDFVKLLHGRKQVEELLVDCSPLYSAKQVTLTTVLPPDSKSIVMPTRSRGTESRFSITVKMRSVNDDHSMISFYKKL